MAMHGDMIAALRANAKRCHLVKVVMPDATVLWTDGGVVKWGADVYRAKNATYGSLKAIGDITDGIEVDGEPVTLSIMPPSLTSLQALNDADAQGGRVEIYLVALVNGVIAGEPYLLYIGELDQPSIQPGPERLLEYEVIPGEARALRISEEQRQTDAFHRYRWPGEKGQQYATDGTKLTYWREDDQVNVLGVTLGRGLADTNKAIQFTYEPNAPFAFPFGRVGIAGGEMRYRIGYGPTNRYQSTVNTIAASGPIQGLVSVAFNDEVTTFDGSNRATNGEYQGFMWFNFQTGAQPSTALTSPTGTEAHSSAAPGWTTDHKLSGSACYMWTGKENSKKSEFGGGLPKPLLVIDGLLGYDPTDVASDLDDPTTWTMLDEGCRVGLNWTIGRWEGDSGGGDYGVPYLCVPVGGIAAPLELIDVDAFETAAGIADTNLWKFAGVAYSDEDRIDVLDDMLAASGARRARKAGRISCVSLAAPLASSLTLTDADTAGSPDIVLAASRLDRINTGIPEFLDGTHRWEITPCDPVSNSAWVTADGGRNTASFTYRFCPDKDQAAQLCYLDMARERSGISVSGTFQTWIMALEPGQTATWDEPEYLLEDVKVRVWKRTYSPSSTLVKMEFRQELSDAEYTAALGETGVTPTPGDPNTPPTDEVDDPTGFSVTVDGDEVTLDWTNGTTNYFRTLIFQGPTTTFADASQVASKGGDPGAANSAVLKPGPGTWYYWVQGRDAFNEVSSEVGPETAVVTVEIDTGNLDDLNILRRTGGGDFTGDLTATEGADFDTNLANVPENIASLAGTEPILNTAITVNADGTLGGAGAGQVTLPGLGAGDLATLDTVALDTQVTDGTTYKRFSATEQTKLSGVETGATAGADFETNVANVPENLAALTGSEVINNATLQTALEAGSVVVSEAANLTGEGALAKSDLTEAEVRGRYLGAYAGNAAAITAGLQDGDAFIDTSVVPNALKVQTASVITEVDTAGIRKVYEDQTDVTAESFTTYASLALTGIEEGSQIRAWFTMEVETSPSNTRQSIGGTTQPAGSYEIVETGGATSRTMIAGTWEATPVGSGGGTDDYINLLTIDGEDDALRIATAVSPGIVVSVTGNRTYILQMKKNAGVKSLEDVGLKLFVQVQRPTS